MKLMDNKILLNLEKKSGNTTEGVKNLCGSACELVWKMIKQNYNHSWLYECFLH